MKGTSGRFYEPCAAGAAWHPGAFGHSAREAVRLYRPHLDAIGLTYTPYIAMRVFWEERCVSVQSLGERLHLDSGTLTPLLKKMAAQGLVTRERAVDDERSVIATITAKGEQLKAQAAGIPARVASCVALEPAEAIELHRLLGKILDRPGCGG